MVQKHCINRPFHIWLYPLNFSQLDIASFMAMMAVYREWICIKLHQFLELDMASFMAMMAIYQEWIKTSSISSSILQSGNISWTGKKFGCIYNDRGEMFHFLIWNSKWHETLWDHFSSVQCMNVYFLFSEEFTISGLIQTSLIILYENIY